MGQSKFTSKGIQAIKPPLSGQASYLDGGCQGLNLIVTPSGRKTFYYRASVDGKQRRHRIGVFPDTTLADARKITDGKRVLVGQGLDPDEAIKAKKAEPTLNEFFQEYLEQHAKKHKKTWQYDQDMYRRHLGPRMGSLRLSNINRHHVSAMHTELADKNGRSSADHALALLSVLFNKAMEWEVYRGHLSPTRFVKKFPRVIRKRKLEADEVSRLLRQLCLELNTDLRDYTLISLFTGARKMNVLAMKWSEIDWKGRRWIIPMTKNGESQDVHLHELVIQSLKARRSVVESDFVFPSTSAEGHLKNIKRSWGSMLKRAEITNLTRHDLRRTFATWLGKTGVGAFVISQSLGHKDLKSAQVYTHLSMGDTSKAIGEAISNMLSAASSPANDN